MINLSYSQKYFNENVYAYNNVIYIYVMYINIM